MGISLIKFPTGVVPDIRNSCGRPLVFTFGLERVVAYFWVMKAAPLLNQLINLFWTALCCTPVVLYWLSADRTWLWPFLVISGLGLLVSSRFYRLSRKARFYKSLGVKWVRLVVQDGELISRFTRRTVPGHRVIRNRKAGRNYLRTVAMYERFHFLGLLFFSFSTVHAALAGRYGMALLLLTCNIVYNIYPLLLQQFNRLRLERLLDS